MSKKIKGTEKQGGKQQPKAETKPVSQPAVSTVKEQPVFEKLVLDNSRIFKNVFFGSLVVMLLIMLVGGYNVGFHTDEMDMNNYAKANVAYYLSGGKDTTYLGYNVGDENKIETILRYYGSTFEYIPVLFNKITGLEKSPSEFNVRHMFIQLFAALALLFTGLIAKRVSGWKGAVFSIWLLFLTPAFLGGSFFNSKDIPFCAGYVATLYYIIRFIEELPRPGWKATLALMVAFAFTTSTRIGGLMLLFFFGLAFVLRLLTDRALLAELLQNVKDIAVKVITIGGGGLALIILSWPYVLSNPGEHLSETLTVVKKFPMKIPLNYDGVFTDSLNIPPDYLPRFISITVPVFVLVAIVAGCVLLLLNFRRLNWQVCCLILFASVFPVAYAISSNVALYSAWRHFMFIYPGLCIIAGTGIWLIFERLKQPALRGALLAACLLAMVHPISWMVKNHPYEYAYFNEISGGYKKIYYEYETDYWKITMKNGLDWLMKHEQLTTVSDSVTVATDMDMFVKYYLKRHYPGAKVRVVLSDVANRFGVNWKYAVYSKQFLSPQFLEQYFPPSETIYSEKVDGMPETVVLKDVQRIDEQAKDAFIANNFPRADSLLTLYLKGAANNVGIYGVVALVKSYVNKNEDALRYGTLALQMPTTELAHYNALCGMGVAYGNMKKYDSSLSKLQQAQALIPTNGMAPNLYNKVLQFRQADVSGGVKN